MIYNNFKYVPWKESEEDNCKIFHEVITPEGQTIYADFTPYTEMSEYEFKTWVDLGLPERISNRPLDGDDLNHIALVMSMVKR